MRIRIFFPGSLLSVGDADTSDFYKTAKAQLTERWMEARIVGKVWSRCRSLIFRLAFALYQLSWNGRIGPYWVPALMVAAQDVSSVIFYISFHIDNDQHGQEIYRDIGNYSGCGRHRFSIRSQRRDD